MRPTALNEGRGLNPGDTRLMPWSTVRRSLNEGRGLNPGDGRTTDAPLNEGRGLNPGDTHRA